MVPSRHGPDDIFIDGDGMPVGDILKLAADRRVTAVPLYAFEQVVGECIEAVRKACTVCDGFGQVVGPEVPGVAIECEYCGRPIAALRRLEGGSGG